MTGVAIGMRSGKDDPGMAKVYGFVDTSLTIPIRSSGDPCVP
ncbi:hypothetical protein PAJL_1741 [Cutibacterium acnes HL042PA3]|uniref:Uncharacterized protein n=1 Tax=Cutibacterium avidum ATCC 25577 TaxID=997355 RepID=G4CVL0_9ACTN|nr:hypothetical protein HMPREF9603_00529 [Cutibacterium acnes HL001PA1]EFT09165.1 hypothetical protein HMPREF9619_02450 [Cutibacterium acnes HL082PA2]EFT27178.1 hypothetical protein HMPREF9577_00210 [Cutibacterium acnes HL110PA3]EFT62595.1 hypothetical protein HMPREF9578_02197 [Cutibacterium acnes HL110PA4]EFT65870.1 hypothetical protein HMPREF9582_01615 [Cutibacterium acnes HL060PA1]EFT76089.1 hypothetical protein HMPREF9599_00069 [Cutibacterium acnes HL050PA2]EGE67586.1 hypothetical protein